MGKVDQAQDAVNHRVPNGDESIEAAQRDTIRQVLHKQVKRHSDTTRSEFKFRCL